MGTLQDISMPSDDATPTWGWYNIGAVMLLVLLGVVGIFSVLFIAHAFGIKPGDGITSPVFYMTSSMLYGLTLMGVYLFAARRSGWRALGVVQPPLWALLITPLLLIIELLGMVAINQSIATYNGNNFENPQFDALTSGGRLNATDIILLLLLIAVLAPIAEELFFRGMIYPLLRHNIGTIGAIVGSAAIFAAFHFIPILLPALFFVGVLLGFLREYSKSVIPCIALHMLQNGFVVMAVGISLMQQDV